MKKINGRGREFLSSISRKGGLSNVKKRMIAVILATVLLPMAVFAGVNLTVGANGGSSWYMSVPRFTDELPFRSSITADAGITLGVIEDELNYEVSLIGAFKFVSYSPVFNDKRARQFIGGGGGPRLLYLFSEHWGAFAEGILFSNRYVVDQAFLSAQVKIGPYYQFLGESDWRLALELPIGIEFRKDVVGVTVGVMVHANYDIPKGGNV